MKTRKNNRERIKACFPTVKSRAEAAKKIGISTSLLQQLIYKDRNAPGEGIRVEIIKFLKSEGHKISMDRLFPWEGE